MIVLTCDVSSATRLSTSFDCGAPQHNQRVMKEHAAGGSRSPDDVASIARGVHLWDALVGVVEAGGLGCIVDVRYQAPLVHDAVGGVFGAGQELLQQPRPVLADLQRRDVAFQSLHSRHV